MLPPGPSTPVPITLYRWMREPFSLMQDLSDRYGETFTVKLGVMPPLVMLSNPAHVREVFAGSGDDLHSGKVAVALKPFLGERSLIVIDGIDHRQTRKLVMPPFHGERLHTYGTQISQITHDALDLLPVGTSFAVHKPLQAITLEVILRTVFGLDDPGLRERLRALLVRLLDLGAWPPLLFPALQHDLGPLSPWGRFSRIGALADRILLEQIDHRRYYGTAHRQDILSLLIDARDEDQNPLSDTDLRDQLITLLVAGHETTATALSWAFYEIFRHPDVHARLRQELSTAQQHSPLTPERIEKLPYLEAVLRESLRVHPIIPIVGRMLQRPMRIATYDLPENTIVAPSVYLVHHNPKLYPDPQRFDPQRFVGKNPPSWEWLPFGGGHRRCIGMAFSLYEMKIITATVLSRTWAHLTPGYSIQPIRRSITLSPSHGVPITLDTRLPRREFSPPLSATA